MLESRALLSPCGDYRYLLLRRWQPGPPLLFVMLNPSRADAEQDDPTLRRCIGFAQAHGYGAVEVVNLYAWRSPHPRELKAKGCPVGPDNDRHIRAALKRAGHLPLCLATTRHGQPAHPLRLRSSLRLQVFAPP